MTYLNGRLEGDRLMPSRQARRRFKWVTKKHAGKVFCGGHGLESSKRATKANRRELLPKPNRTQPSPTISRRHRYRQTTLCFHGATKLYAPNGKRECARRRRQIAAGQLSVAASDKPEVL